MILLFAADAELLPEVLDELPADLVQVAVTWTSFVKHLSGAAVGVVAVRSLGEPLLSATAALVRRTSSKVVVCSRDASPRDLSPVPDLILGTIDQVEDLVRHLINRHDDDAFAYLLDHLRSNLQDRSIASRAVNLLRSARPPFRSVRELARALGMSDSVLHYHWTAAGMPDISLKQLLEVVLLLRAVEQRPSASWTRIAYLIGVHRRTLERIAVRRTSCTLATLGRRGLAETARIAASRLLA